MLARSSSGKLCKAIVASLLLSAPTNSLKIWPNAGSLPSLIPAGCRAALSGEISCPDLITPYEISNDVPINPDFLDKFCVPGCKSSLQTWAANVNTRCGDTIYSFNNATNQSGNAVAQPLLWAQNMACLTESTSSAFCYPQVLNRTVTACADCTLRYLSGMLNSTYGHRKISDQSFTSLLSSCGSSPTKFPHSTVTFPPPEITGTPRPSCLGTNYTVKSGDTCKSIADGKKVAIDRFLSDNSLDYKCEGLTVGSTVCIGDSCTLQTIQANQTCKDILAGKSYTIVQLRSWNPIIHSKCDNLDALVGHSICVSPPGGEWNVPTTTTWNDTYTIPPGEWSALPSAVDATNKTRTDPFAFGSIPTVTATGNMASLSAGAARITNCPVNEEVVQKGFLWDWLPADCQSVMEPYCTPFLNEPAPPSTTFASSCMPSVIMGL